MCAPAGHDVRHSWHAGMPASSAHVAAVHATQAWSLLPAGLSCTGHPCADQNLISCRDIRVNQPTISCAASVPPGTQTQPCAAAGSMGVVAAGQGAQLRCQAVQPCCACLPAPSGCAGPQVSGTPAPLLGAFGLKEGDDVLRKAACEALLPGSMPAWHCASCCKTICYTRLCTAQSGSSGLTQRVCLVFRV